ncbi:hypothetical protein Acr_08g0013430 [Actinidia rufa]|uniref:Reverse transcriptase RNase H-like domain-containing protein n=1 Tax=Actinidia rufa TaxID=165716 RepID=A0A7J0F4U0_9ERIC|nr:hypothetical protein Acr_08g0013430 [Actinidia rufa]
MNSVLDAAGSCNLSMFGIGELHPIPPWMLPPSMLSPPKPCAGFGRGFCGTPPIGGLSIAFGFCGAKLGSPPFFILVFHGKDQPLKQILQRPDTSGRLLKWSIELSEFHIEYKPRTAIKAQALSDFIVESTHEDTPQPETTPLKEFKINQIPREDNKKADALANLASTFEFISDRCIPLEFLTHPSIGVANQILQTEENPTWLDEIIDYLRKGILPKDKLQARRLQYRSARFCIFEGRLYKRSFSGPLLRCLRPEEAKYVYEKYTKAYAGITPEPDRWQRKLFAKDILADHGTRCGYICNEGELRLNLDLLDEKRESAELRQAAYKGRIAKYYNERVEHRSFLPGDLVWRRVTLSTRDPSAGKLGPTWEGPYKVIKVSRPGTCWLEDLNGKALSHPWNAEHLKKYYQ